MKKIAAIPSLIRDLRKYLFRFQLGAGMTRKFCLIGIIILAAFLRFYKLGQIPSSLDWDEASLGYNAWALAETGKDEFGNSWPLSIRSFGDYKPPIYTYLLIPSIKIFGRSDFAIRFPSALAGTGLILVVYLLVKVLLRPGLPLGGQTFSEKIALVSAFLLAISPWHLQFSRIAFEANVGLFFFVIGMWLIFQWINQKNSGWSLFFSSLAFSASLMSYHSLRVVAPLILLSGLFIYRHETYRKIRRRPWILAASLIPAILTISAIVFTIFFQNVGQSRFNETSFLTIDDLMTVSRRRIEKSGRNFWDRIANHRFFVYGRQYARGYLDHYNLRFWFLDGDRIDRHRTPGAGLLYWWEGGFFFIGLISLIRPMGFIRRKTRKALFAWFLLAPAAAALTGGTPSAVRSLAFLPTFQIIEGIGIIWAIRRISRIWLLFLVSCFLFLAGFEISYYFHQYYIQAPVETAPSWQYGYKQLVGKIMGEKDNYGKVIVTTAYDQPYIYFLWYGSYDPKQWVNDGKFNQRFDKFEFRKIDWDQLSDQRGALAVSSPDETKGRPVKWQINYPDGQVVFNAIEL